MKRKKIRTVLAFGTFDGIHPGHVHFLKKAASLGSLWVSVGSSANTLALKGHRPLYSENKRKKALESLAIADHVFVGKEKPGSWNVLKKIKPDIIALGYDQRELKQSLKKYTGNKSFTISIIKSLRPRLYHSRILKNRAKNS